MARIEPTQIATMRLDTGNTPIANFFGPSGNNLYNLKGLNTIFTASVSSRFSTSTPGCEDQKVYSSGNMRSMEPSDDRNPSIIFYADKEHNKRIRAITTRDSSYPLQFGAYYNVFRPCIGKGVRSDESRGNIFGVILETDIRTDTSLVFMMHDVRLNYKTDASFYTGGYEHNFFVDYESGIQTKYMYYSIGILDHINRKFQHFLCSDVPITTISNGTWQHGWHRIETYDGQIMYAPNNYTDGSNGWEKQEFCNRSISIQKWIENDVVSYSIKSINNVNSNNVLSGASYVDNGYNHYVTVNEPSNATLIVALTLDGTQSGMDFNHVSVRPFLKYGETRDTFYRPWGILQFHDSSNDFSNSILPGIVMFFGRHTADTLVTSSAGKQQLTGLSVSMNNYTYGGTYLPSPSVNNNHGYGKAQYTYINSSGTDIGSTRPTEPGTYKVKVTVPDTDNYYSGAAEKTFTISKGSFTITVSMASYESGGTPSEPSITNNKSGGAVTYQYKLTSDPDTSYTTTKPTSPGNYTVKATVAETQYYNSSSNTSTFNVTGKIDINPSVSMADWTYGQTASNPVLTGNDGNATVTYKYKISSAADSTYTTTKPSVPNTYTVKAEIQETATHNGGSATVNFTILKANISITVTMESYMVGKTPSNPSVTGNTGNGAVTYTYKVSTASDSTYTATKPTTPGSYTVKAVVAATECYNTATSTANFIVKDKANLTLSLTMESYQYGKTPTEPVLTGNAGNGTVTYEYKTQNASDSTYVSAKPTEVGSYTVRANVAETDDYKSGTAIASFYVNKANLSLTVTMESYTDEDDPTNPVLTGNLGNGAVTYSYKPSGSNDSSYTSNKPIAVGAYTVRAVVRETTNYNGGTAIGRFTVTHVIRIKINPTVSLQNYHIDELVNLLNDGNVPIPTVTGNTGNAPVKFEYKRKSVPSTEYSNRFPNDIGAYDIRAYVHKTNEYEEAECFGTFSIYNVDVDERDGTSVVSMYSNIEAGNVSDIDTKLFAEYKKNNNTIRDKMSIMTMDTNNRYKILLQGAVDNDNVVTIESSISGKINFIIEKCVIMGDRIICYTDSKHPRTNVDYNLLPGTPFSSMAINTEQENNFIIENMPEGHYGYIIVPIYEQYPIMTGNKVSSYNYRRIGENKISLDNGYMFDIYDSSYYALPDDMPVFSNNEIVITKSGWSVSRSGVCRHILTLPLKYIKDYFPDSRIYYETQVTI